VQWVVGAVDRAGDIHELCGVPGVGGNFQFGLLLFCCVLEESELV